MASSRRWSRTALTPRFSFWSTKWIWCLRKIVWEPLARGLLWYRADHNSKLVDFNENLFDDKQYSQTNYPPIFFSWLDSKWNATQHQFGTKLCTGRSHFARNVCQFLFILAFILTNLCVSSLLSRAWSEIVYSLIPNVELLESQLDDFTTICAADEVVLFERATFLVISHVSKFK